jgi:hypothetical protein
MKIKDIDLNSLLKSKYAPELLLSLSRASRMLQQIMCEEPQIVTFLKSSFSVDNIMIVANISINCKIFLKDCLPTLRSMAL